LGAATKIGQRDGRLVEMYLFVAAVYFFICYLLSWQVRKLQVRTAIVR
jgi:glutamate/aspartate transport system permease protein